jgi:hypothetical protein
MKGEAYFIRAFDYTNLMRSYGGLVLISEPFELGEDFLSVTRSNLDETLDFIIADVDKAIQLLPEKDEIEQGRATKGAAAALKSRLLSWSTGELMHGGYSTDPLVSFQSHSRDALLQEAKSMAKAIMDGNYGHYALTGTTDDPPSPMTQEIITEYSDNFFNIFTQTRRSDVGCPTQPGRRKPYSPEPVVGTERLPQLGKQQSAGTCSA